MTSTSFTSFDPNRVDQIVEALSTMLMRRSIARELEALKQFSIVPEQVDDLVLAAINISLNLEDERLASDIPPLSIDEQLPDDQLGHPKTARAA